jgi:hypothetical protein
MRVAHRHGQTSVTEDSLQRQDIPARHHEVARECVPDGVGHLAVGQPNARAFDGLPEGCPGIAEHAFKRSVLLVRNAQGLHEFVDDGYRSNLAALRPRKLDVAVTDLTDRDLLRLAPSRSGAQREPGPRTKLKDTSAATSWRLFILRSSALDAREREVAHGHHGDACDREEARGEGSDQCPDRGDRERRTLQLSAAGSQTIQIRSDGTWSLARSGFSSVGLLATGSPTSGIWSSDPSLAYEYSITVSNWAGTGTVAVAALRSNQSSRRPLKWAPRITPSKRSLLISIFALGVPLGTVKVSA